MRENQISCEAETAMAVLTQKNALIVRADGVII